MQQFYFIEVTRPSGMKTYVGWEMEELFYPLRKITADLGFKTEDDAKQKINEVAKMLKSAGTMYSSLKVIDVKE